MLVLFDRDCPTCVLLAQFLQRHNGVMEYRAWQDFVRNPPEGCPALQGEAPVSLAVWKDSKLYQGTEAWECVLQHDPSLDKLAWLATKLGVERPVAKALQLGGRAARMLCLGCPSEFRKKR